MLIIPIAFGAAVAVADLNGCRRTRRRGQHEEPPYWVRDLARLRAYYAVGGLEQRAVARMARLETRLARKHRRIAGRST